MRRFWIVARLIWDWRGGGFRGVGLGVRVIVWVFGRECRHRGGLQGVNHRRVLGAEVVFSEVPLRRVVQAYLWVHVYPHFHRVF